MNNVFCTPLKIDYRYDLKGSLVGRKTIWNEGEPRDKTVALKDLDFLEEGKKFCVDRESKRKLI
jgi:1-phosphatidylinositol-4-phosphate 5-kinase